MRKGSLTLSNNDINNNSNNNNNNNNNTNTNNNVNDSHQHTQLSTFIVVHRASLLAVATAPSDSDVRYYW
jgi:hypothetical protein